MEQLEQQFSLAQYATAPAPAAPAEPAVQAEATTAENA